MEIFMLIGRNVIATLREFDVKGKGVGFNAVPQGDLLKELLVRSWVKGIDDSCTIMDYFEHVLMDNLTITRKIINIVSIIYYLSNAIYQLKSSLGIL